MTIRMSTENRARAGAAAAVALAGAAAVHAAWAAGSTFPAADRTALAELVVGRPPFPSAGLTAAVATALAAAAAVIGERAIHSTPRPGRWEALSGAAAWAVSGALLVRGVGGLVWGAAGATPGAEPFRYWDLRLYSPLCVLIGLGAASVARRSPR